MGILPQDRPLTRRDAYFSLVLAPLEFVTASLRKGDEWDTTDLQPFVNRCRALVEAYDHRVERAGGAK